MKHIRARIETLMADDGKSSFPSLEWFLFAVSLLYRFLSGIRAFLYEKEILKPQKIPCPVISIGNLVAGGTGKTPMTICLVELAKKNGYNPVVVSRGYRGESEKRGGIVSDGKNILMDACTAGDEPYMMAKALKNVPVMVGQNRFQSCTEALQKFNPDLIILDDAFQHLQLSRDMDIVLLDYLKPLGNQRFLPRGPLREPVSALRRGSIFIVTRTDVSSTAWPERLNAALNGKPIFFTRHESYIHNVELGTKSILEGKINIGEQMDFDVIKGKKVYLFSGIARNSDFRRSASKFGCIQTGFSEFPDHHFYSPEELETIFCNAEKASAELLVTTEKDFIRINRKVSWPVDLMVIGVRISFDKGATLFESLINRKLRKIQL